MAFTEPRSQTVVREKKLNLTTTTIIIIIIVIIILFYIAPFQAMPNGENITNIFNKSH